MEKMKTKQTKIYRSAAKWLPGAMALAATTASSQAATVQITLTGNKISSTGGNQLNADLTGDNVDDIVVTGGSLWALEVVATVSGGRVSAKWDSIASLFYAVPWFDGGDGGAGSYVILGPSPVRASKLNAVAFTDARINGGALTEGWLQVNAFNTSIADHTVELSRLIFDDASTTRPAFASIPGAQTVWGAVPEPSSLGLLALGAGGLLLRRSRAKAAA